MHKNSTQCHNLPLNTKNCSHFFILSMFDLGTLVRAINTTIHLGRITAVVISTLV